MRRALLLAAGAIGVCAILAASGCGARTGLGVEVAEREDASRPDAGLVDGSFDMDAHFLDARVGVDAPLLCEVGAIAHAVAPNIVFVLDRSGSMSGRLPRSDSSIYSGTSRWNIMREFLAGSASLLAARETRARFGLVTYAGREDACPTLGVVPAEFSSSDAIREELRRVGPGGGTPTAEAIESVVADLIRFAPTPAPTWLILASDGEPNGCPGTGPGDPYEATIDAVRAGFDAGLRTYVVSVGEDIAELHLREVANVGTGLARETPDTPVYVGSGPTLLYALLDHVIALSVECRLSLTTPVSAERACRDARVYVGSSLLACAESGSGYRVIDEGTTIEILGEACDSMRRGMPLRIELPCSP